LISANSFDTILLYAGPLFLSLYPTHAADHRNFIPSGNFSIKLQWRYSLFIRQRSAQWATVGQESVDSNHT